MVQCETFLRALQPHAMRGQIVSNQAQTSYPAHDTGGTKIVLEARFPPGMQTNYETYYFCELLPLFESASLKSDILAF